MKNLNYKYIGLAILIVGGYLIYQKVKKAKSSTNDIDALKESYIDTILSDSRTTTEDRSFLETQSTPYLKDWARAVKANQARFTSSGIVYSLIGGQKVK